MRQSQRTQLQARLKRFLRRQYYRAQNAMIGFWWGFGARHPQVWQQIKRLVGADYE